MINLLCDDLLDSFGLLFYAFVFFSIFLCLAEIFRRGSKLHRQQARLSEETTDSKPVTMYEPDNSDKSNAASNDAVKGREVYMYDISNQSIGEIEV